MKLNNGYGLMERHGKSYIVKAIFRGVGQIVFEGINREECIKYCHEHGMKAIDRRDYIIKSNPSFVKKNAKHPFNPAEWFVGTVG